MKRPKGIDIKLLQEHTAHFTGVLGFTNEGKRQPMYKVHHLSRKINQVMPRGLRVKT